MHTLRLQIWLLLSSISFDGQSVQLSHQCPHVYQLMHKTDETDEAVETDQIAKTEANKAYNKLAFKWKKGSLVRREASRFN